MCTRTTMLEISWLPRSLEGADASFWPANVCLFIFPGLCASFCFWVHGLTLFRPSWDSNPSRSPSVSGESLSLSLSLFRTPRSSRLPRSSKLYLGPLIRTAWTRIVGIDSQDSQEIEDKRNHRSQRKTSMMDGIFL